MGYINDTVLFQIGETALEKLKSDYLPEERSIQEIFRIIYEPAFEECESWQLFKSKSICDEEVFFIFKSVWDRASDSNKLDIPMLELKIRYNKVDLTPTIIREKINLDQTFVKDLLSKLEKIKIYPMIEEKIAGCDGTSYEFRIDRVHNRCSYRWWEKGRKNCSELIAYVYDTLENFRNIKETHILRKIVDFNNIQ